MKKEKTKKRNDGFGLRLTFGIILVVVSVVLFVFIGKERAFLFVSPAMLILGIFQIICAVIGRKKEWANVVSIVIGAIFIPAYLLGLFALLGGIFGRRPFKQARAEEKARLAKEIQPERVETVQHKITEVEDKTEVFKDPAEYIQPKLSPKAKKGMFISVIISYFLLLLVGILFVAVPGMGNIFSGMGICEEIAADAYAVTVGTMWLALLPTLGYYVAFMLPTELDKKKKIVATAVSVALSVALCAVFFVVIYCVKIDGIAVNLYFEDDDKWFIPVSMVFAVIGIAVCYALTLFKLNPANLKTSKPEKCGDGFFAVIKHVFAYLVYGITKLTKSILTFKEKQPEIFLFVATVLFTWLVYFVSFVASIIVLAVLLGVVCMWFFGSIHLLYLPTKYTPKQISVDGKVLTKNDNIAGLGYSEVYTDEYGNVYYSNDGGKSVIGSVDRGIAEREAELEKFRAEEAANRRREEEEAEELRRLNDLNNKWN